MSYNHSAEEIKQKGFLSNAEKNSTLAIWYYAKTEPIPLTLSPAEIILSMYKYGYLADCNDAMAKLYNFKDADHFIGTPLVETFPANQENIVLLEKFIENGYTLVNALSKERDVNGNTKYFLNSFGGIIENNHLLGTRGIQREIRQHEARNYKN
jgi:hypothetical protein